MVFCRELPYRAAQPHVLRKLRTSRGSPPFRIALCRLAWSFTSSGSSGTYGKPQNERFHPDRFDSALMLLHVRRTIFDTLGCCEYIHCMAVQHYLNGFCSIKNGGENSQSYSDRRNYNVNFYELLNKHELALVMRSEWVLCERSVINIGPDGLAVKKGSALIAEHLHGLASRTCSTLQSGERWSR